MNNSRVQVLNRALDLIELLATSENGLSIADLSAATDLPKSTIHRILTTYTERHYIEKDEETCIYSLGYKFVEIASIYLNKIVLKTEATPIMHEMATIFEATSYLGVLENNEVMYLERVEKVNTLRLPHSPGSVRSGFVRSAPSHPGCIPFSDSPFPLHRARLPSAFHCPVHEPPQRHFQGSPPSAPDSAQYSWPSRSHGTAGQSRGPP